VPQLAGELKKLGAEDIVIVCGGVIPRQDYDALYAAGASRIFGPGTPITVSAAETLDAIEEKRK
jgi:methylmalonyl-CoA mutase